MATVEDQLLTIIGNQQTIIANQATALTAIQGIAGVNTDTINAALAQIEGQVADIDAQLKPTASAPVSSEPVASVSGATS